MPTLSEIKQIKSQYDYLAYRQDYHGCMLAAETDEVYVICTSLLLDFAYTASNRISIFEQQRDPFASGGQLVADVAIIEYESDMYNVAGFKTGFANLYWNEYHEGIREFPKVARIVDIHADLLTMDDLGVRVRMEVRGWIGIGICSWQLARIVLGYWGSVIEYGDEDMYWDVVWCLGVERLFSVSTRMVIFVSAGSIGSFIYD